MAEITTYDSCADAKKHLATVPPVWLAVISGGLAALATLALAGLTGFPGGGPAGAVHLDAGQQAVAISSKALGSFLEVSLEDGLLRAGAGTPEGLASHFMVVPLTEATVASLRLATATTAKLASKWHDIQMTTRSGCNCTGFSNEHGFGSYCHAWELSYQDPWCYVSEACPGGKKGSYNRRHEVCTPEPPPPPKDEYNYSSTFTSSNKEEFVGHWQAPAGCACSGYSSKLGYGASCKAWEEKIAPHQTPWCYVHNNCTLAERRKGSFGHRHIDCEYVYSDSKGETPVPMPQGPIKAKKSKKPLQMHPAASEKGKGSFLARLLGRRLALATPHQQQPHQPQPPHLRQSPSQSQSRQSERPRASRRLQQEGAHQRRLQQEYPMSRASRKRERQALRSQEHVAEEAALLRRVADSKVRWVALISAATRGFVTIERPPHKNALLVHAQAAQLSLGAVFALMPSGAIFAAGTNALLTLCDPADKRNAKLCSGFKPNPSDPHRKLLRAEEAAAAPNAALFELHTVTSH